MFAVSNQVGALNARYG